MVVRSNRTLAFAVATALGLGSALGCNDSSPHPGNPSPDGGNQIDAGVPPDGEVTGDAPVNPDPDAPPPDAPQPPPPDFFTSFETNDPQPTWTDTVEVDAAGHKRTERVTGSPSTLILGNIMRRVSAILPSSTNSPAAEGPANIADGEVTSKWLIFVPTGWIQLQLAEPVAVKRYAVTSANDSPERDPRNWTLEGSQDGQAWSVVDTQTNQSFALRFETHTHEIANDTAYLYYRLNVSANHSGNILQIAEVQLSDGDNTPPPVTDMKSSVGGGPGASHNAKLGGGFTGPKAFRFSGGVIGGNGGFSYNKIFEVDIPVLATTALSYKLFVDEAVNDLTYPSTYAAVDLAFDDGTYLSNLNATDQHHAVLSPTGQGASRTLYAGEWNEKVARIGEVAAGKRIKRILVGYELPTGSVQAFGGWIDDLRISAAPVAAAPAHLSDYVSTLRGTNSSGGYSRGNNFPATAVPHGFNFWTPATDAGSNSWIYEYARANDDQNRPMLQALSLSHEPSPWMGDRQSFQVMPSAAEGTPNAGRSARALPFQHANEVARPYYYGVNFDGGIRAELAPTDHAAIFRFTFTGANTSLIFDNFFDQNNRNPGRLTLDPGTGSLSAVSDARSGLSTDATRMYAYATFDKPVTESGMLDNEFNLPVTGYMRFAAGDDHTVTMRIATSLISLDQAKKNLALEIAEGDTLESVKARAQAMWDEKLGIVEIEGANADELTTLYSNLYRLFLYPNSAFENTGTAEAPVYKYASQMKANGATAPNPTAPKIADGKLYVNNGFWDTYRATWPAYSLLAPGDATELIGGFAQQYLDGGWISRWSSPGYADLMTGTSSDVAFADAYVKGVRGFNAEAVYDAAVRNATVRPPNNGVGRKGMVSSPFLGYTATETDGAAVSWAMAGYLNDFGIANMAEALAANTTGGRHKEYAENAIYFRNRALNYVKSFDPAIGFFQNRRQNGSFERAPGNYDPRNWGFGYTETNGWNTAFDTTYDGLGLANLYGGRAQLGAKLDAFFATPETAMFPGGYGGTIHEMIEARDVRMGQLGLSNQVSYHIIYMYNHAGQPSKTQQLVRDALGRLYIGSGIGQGYLGDDDNGASSAWQIFGALGFYPLQVGSASYVIGSPLFKKATVHLESGHDLVINAPNNSAKNVYVQGLKLNGEAYTKTYLTHDQLVGGATLDFDMGPAPSSWGTGEDNAPPSITTGTEVARPLTDVATGGTATASGGVVAATLFDNSSANTVTFNSATASVQYALPAAKQVAFYTLTSNAAPAPTGWKLSGSNDGGATWTQIDERSGETFRWTFQTRAFQVATPGSYATYRLELTGRASIGLSEVELLATP